MISALYVYMRAARIRHKGKNENGYNGWTKKEEIHFEQGMSLLHGDLKSSIETNNVSRDKVMQLYEKMWSFIEFNEEGTVDGIKERREWFLKVV